MSRKSILAAVAGLALVAFLALTSPAQAQSVLYPRPNLGYAPGFTPAYPGLVGPGYNQYPTFYPTTFQRHYLVLYRGCAFEPWRTYGTYHSHWRAHQVADFLRLGGQQAYVTHY